MYLFFVLFWWQKNKYENIINGIENMEKKENCTKTRFIDCLGSQKEKINSSSSGMKWHSRITY